MAECVIQIFHWGGMSNVHYHHALVLWWQLLEAWQDFSLVRRRLMSHWAHPCRASLTQWNRLFRRPSLPRLPCVHSERPVIKSHPGSLPQMALRHSWLPRTIGPSFALLGRQRDSVATVDWKGGKVSVEYAPRGNIHSSPACKRNVSRWNI